MKNQPNSHGSIMRNTRIDEASDHSRQQLEERAAELAEIRGVSDGRFNDEDLRQARRELEGRTLATPEGGDDESSENSLSRDPSDIPAQSGHRVPDQLPDDEESAAARLALEGVDAAERENMLAARRRHTS